MVDDDAGDERRVLTQIVDEDKFVGGLESDILFITNVIPRAGDQMVVDSKKYTVSRVKFVTRRISDTAIATMKVKVYVKEDTDG